MMNEIVNVMFETIPKQQGSDETATTLPPGEDASASSEGDKVTKQQQAKEMQSSEHIGI